MSVPNHRSTIDDLFATGRYDLSTHSGQAAFVDDCVAALHQRDARWGFLRKTGSGKHIHGHSEDGALYLSDTPGQSQHVDFIANAGAPNASPGWSVDIPRYSPSDWWNPDDHTGTVQPPANPTPEVPGPTLPTPPAPTVDLTPIVAELAALARVLGHITEQLQTLGSTVRAIEADNANLTNIALDNSRQIERLVNHANPDYVGRIFGVNVTLRPKVTN